MYSIGQILYTKRGLTDKTLFYIVSDKFTNYYGETVYQIEPIIDDKYGPSKMMELSKFMDWLHKADDLMLFQQQMFQTGDIFQYIGETWYTNSKENSSTYIIIDATHAPIYKMMCMFDNSELYEDEDRLTNGRLYRILA